MAEVVAEVVAEPSERPGGPRSRKGERTRARLVDAARLVFEEQGFLDARVSDIVERAGLSHGSFYHYFDSKEDVFAAVAAALDERMNLVSLGGDILHSIDAEVDTVELVRHMVHGYFAHYRADARIMGVVEQVTRYNEEFRMGRVRREALYTTDAAAGLARLQAAGRADPTLDPRVVGPALMGMVTRFAEMWLVQGTVDCDLEAAADNLAALVANSLGVAPRPVG